MLVGIDVLDVVRMEKFVQNEHFLEKYFTPYEIEYVSKNNRQTLYWKKKKTTYRTYIYSYGIYC